MRIFTPIADVGPVVRGVNKDNPITPITYNTSSNAIGANFTGVPTGVTGTFSNGQVTISGSPSVAGFFFFSVTLNPGTCLLGVRPTRRGLIAVAPTISATATSICGSGSTTLSFVPNVDAGWTWYEGGCGQGTAIGTGNSIDVTPTQTTTYYVRLEGPLGFANNPICASIIITVNTPQNWYLDADNDNYYTGSPVSACSSPGQGYKTSVTGGGNDCDDSNPNVNPGATEVCANSIDDNCNGLIDENCCRGIIISVPRCAIIWETAGGVTYGQIVVALNKPCSSPVSADWMFANGTFVNPVNNATQGSDFNAGSGKVTFDPGVTEQTITLEVLSDGLVEDFEYVNIVFSNPVNATTENGRALIGSTDTYPCRSEAIPTYTEGSSGNQMVEYIMTLNKPYPEAVSVAYRTANNSAIAGQDYVEKSGVVTFEPNQTSATIQLEIIGDHVKETPVREGFFLILTQPNKLGCNGPEAYAAIFINDDDNGNPPAGPTSAIRANGFNATSITSNLWPNPVQSQLNVTLSGPIREKVTLQLVDAQGKIVKQRDTQLQSRLGNTVTIGVGDLPQGLYKLLVNGQTFRETKSVLIQR